MPASASLIWRSAVIAAVTAGLKWAPDTTARVWISTNRTSMCTSPITEKSMKWFPLGFDAVLRILPVLAAAISLAACGDDERRQVTLALDFQPNAVHAGIYAALGNDLDARRGLDLRVRVPSASTDSLKLLAAGRAHAPLG